MTALAKLLPCPFCGGSSLTISRMHGTGDRYVVCQTPECKTCGPSGDAREDAIATWNRRAALSPAELGGVEAVAWYVGDDNAHFYIHKEDAETEAAKYGLPITPLYTTPRAAEAVTVDKAMIERAVGACIQSKGRYSAYHAPETDDEWRAALTASLTPPSAKGE